MSHLKRGGNVLFSAAVVCLLTNEKRIKAIIDIYNFITKWYAELLNLKEHKMSVMVLGLENATLNANSWVNASIVNQDKTYIESYSFLSCQK